MKLFLLVLGALLVAAPAHAITFNDGGTHIIDAENSYPLDPVVVEDSPTGQPTTLIINEGGDIGSISGDGLTANGSTVVNINGGSVSGTIRLTGTSLIAISDGHAGNVYLCDGARYTQSGGNVGRVSDLRHYTGCDIELIPNRYSMSGGVMDSFAPTVGGLEMVGGLISGETWLQNTFCFPVNVSNGSIARLRTSCLTDVTFSGTAQVYLWSSHGSVRVRDNAVVTGCDQWGIGLLILEGGTLSGNCDLRGTLQVYGGTLSGNVKATTNWSSFGNCCSSRFEVLGGPVLGTSNFEMRGDSTALVAAGPFTTHSFTLFDTAFLEIVGTDFNYPLGLISDGAGALGALTGTLADGSAISIDFQKTSTASVLLRAPATPTNSDLEVSFVSPPTTVDTYGSVNLSFSVTNNGPDPADNVEVTFEAPATAIDPTITTGTWSQSGSTFTSDLGTLASGASSTFEMTYSVGGDAGTLDHQVSVLSNIYDPISIDADETNNTETAAITVQCGTTTVFAQNPTTGTWVAFPSSCDVPPGWTVSQTIPDGYEPVGTDSDGDGVVDENDNCSAIANTDQADLDEDGEGDACDLDNDNDGVVDENDNCPAVANLDQANNDGDLNGDVCDLDNDNDGIADVATTVNTVSGTYRSAGGTNLYVPEGIGPTFVIGQIVAIALDDGSTFSPIITSYNEADTESDRIWLDRPFPSPMSAGNAVTQTIADLDPMDPAVCIDADVDTCDDCSVGVDGFGALADNDPANDGTDTDSDGACDAGDNDDDNDGVPDEADAFSLDATEDTDTDGDGVGNNADTDDDGDGYSDAEEVAAGSDPLDPNSIPAEVAVPSLSPVPLATLAALLLGLGLTLLTLRRRYR